MCPRIFGNRINVDGTSYTANNLNQYTTVGAVNYSYDPNGNMTSDGTWTYGYDEENRLTSAVGAGTTAGYVYDGLGRRIEKNVNGTITKYVYDGDRVIEEYDGGGVLQAEYIYGIGIDEVVAMERGANRYHFVDDGLGTVAKLVDNLGADVEVYTYDAYGAPTAISTVSNPHMFTGREYDSETGLYYYRARMYNPSLGRFLQRDPIGHKDNVNLYTYVRNNPVMFVDPWGMEALAVSIWEDPIFLISELGVGLAKYFTRLPQITGFTNHALGRMMERTTLPQDIFDTVNNPTSVYRTVDEIGRVAYKYVGEKATVILNKLGKVITFWP